ncbi:armadillo-type protein [Pilobolus umbonatus]|nr:armadillo-type protein [Pilobolus umbonatus]
MDIDRIISIIKAIPYISKTIVDDTLYDKVLSYLTIALSSHSIINESFQQINIFDIIDKACQVEDQDSRVITLCIRLLGQIIYHGEATLFSRLSIQYPDLLKKVTEGLQASEPGMRCASIEACRLFINSERATEWISHHKEVKQSIIQALTDESIYVVTEACKFVSSVLHYSSTTHTTLLHSMDAFDHMKTYLQPKRDQTEVLAALEFTWNIVSLRLQSSLDCLRQTGLLASLLSLLDSTSKIVRIRVIEIVSELYTWDSNPLLTLGLTKDTDGNSLMKGYDYTLRLAMNILQHSESIDFIMTGVSLVDVSMILLTRMSYPHEAPCSTLLSVSNICLNVETKDEHYQSIVKALKGTGRAVFNRRSLLQLTLRTLNKAIPQITDTDMIMEVVKVTLNTLQMDQLSSDQRVLKSTLTLLTTLLYSLIKIDRFNDVQQILSEAIKLLVKMMDENDLVCRNLIAVFSALDDLLKHDKIGVLVRESDTSKTLVEALSLKFLDTEWDVRDAAIEFVGHLFDEPLVDNKVTFALHYHLPLGVFSRIHDSESYVRASAVDVLQKMMKCKQGWNYIQLHKQSRELASALPKLLYDSEAFVRRSALDAVTCLVNNRSCQGMAMEIENSQAQDSLNPELLRKLMYDQDPDVRVRTCILIESLWNLYHHEQQQQKRNQKDIIFFHHINAGELLIQAVMDTQRLVRIEAVRVIESILNGMDISTEDSMGKKRPLDAENTFDTEFLELLRTANLENTKQTLDPEHLYEEAFEINADMMTHSIIPTDPDDDINMLDCY